MLPHILLLHSTVATADFLVSSGRPCNFSKQLHNHHWYIHRSKVGITTYPPDPNASRALHLLPRLPPVIPSCGYNPSLPRWIGNYPGSANWIVGQLDSVANLPPTYSYTLCVGPQLIMISCTLQGAAYIVAGICIHCSACGEMMMWVAATIYPLLGRD